MKPSKLAMEERLGWLYKHYYSADEKEMYRRIYNYYIKRVEYANIINKNIRIL